MASIVLPTTLLEKGENKSAAQWAATLHRCASTASWTQHGS